jgi:DedD protein
MKQGWSSFMDRRVKERLVGGAILALVVVLIVPELLSGPKRAVVVPQTGLPAAAEPMRSVIVDLATNQTTAASAGAATAGAPTGDATPGAPVPEAAAVPGGSAAPEPAGATAEGDATPAAESGSTAAMAGGVTQGAPSAEPSTPAAATPGAAVPARGPPPPGNDASSPPAHHGWAAQLGSFAAHGNAEKLERTLRAQGFAPFLSSTGSGRALRYRVRVGPVADRAAAEKVIVKLHKAGHAATLVVP